MPLRGSLTLFALLCGSCVAPSIRQVQDGRQIVRLRDEDRKLILERVEAESRASEVTPSAPPGLPEAGEDVEKISTRRTAFSLTIVPSLIGQVYLGMDCHTFVQEISRTAYMDPVTHELIRALDVAAKRIWVAGFPGPVVGLPCPILQGAPDKPNYEREGEAGFDYFTFHVIISDPALGLLAGDRVYLSRSALAGVQDVTVKIDLPLATPHTGPLPSTGPAR